MFSSFIFRIYILKKKETYESIKEDQFNQDITHTRNRKNLWI